MEIFTDEELIIITRELKNSSLTFSNGHFGSNYPFISLNMSQHIILGNQILKLKFEKSIQLPPKIHSKNFEPPIFPIVEDNSIRISIEYEINESESIIDYSTIKEFKEEHILLIQFLPFKSLITYKQICFEECFDLWYITKIIPLFKKINQQILTDFPDGHYPIRYFFNLLNNLLPKYSL